MVPLRFEIVQQGLDTKQAASHMRWSALARIWHLFPASRRIAKPSRRGAPHSDHVLNAKSTAQAMKAESHVGVRTIPTFSPSIRLCALSYIHIFPSMFYLPPLALTTSIWAIYTSNETMILSPNKPTSACPSNHAIPLNHSVIRIAQLTCGPSLFPSSLFCACFRRSPFHHLEIQHPFSHGSVGAKRRTAQTRRA